MTELLSYSFAQRAIVTGILIAFVCSILGVFLVLRRISLIGDGLSHIAFGSATLALLLKVNIISASVPLTMLGGFFIARLMHKTRLTGDTAIGIVSATSVAVAVMIASLSGGFNVDIFGFLFGNILTISHAESVVAGVLAFVCTVAVMCFYHDFVTVTFDEELAHVTGIKTGIIDTMLITLTALVVAIAMRLVGVMLVSSLLIIPPVTALYLSRSFRSTLLITIVLAELSVVAGMTISFAYNLPTSATVVLTNVGIFLGVVACKKFTRFKKAL